jgi:7-cyano-7-deazaguanine synthase
MSGKPAIVLLSGGLDSATTLAIAKNQGFLCHCLAFDYGQRHAVELRAAALVARQLDAPLRTVRVDLRAIGGSALTAEIDVPKDRPAHDLAAGIPITYVPARNLIFLSIAAGLAETLDAADLFIGVNAVDYSGYPDCRRPFIDAFERAASLGTRSGAQGHPFRVHTPLVELTKPQIIRTGIDLGVDYSLTTSCYDPALAPDGAPVACGHCDSCQIRAAGFRDAGIPDPTRYRR